MTNNHPAGIVKTQWKTTGTLVTACLDGKLRLVDSRNGEVVREWTGHSAEILDFAMKEDLILTASGDKTAKVFSF